MVRAGGYHRPRAINYSQTKLCPLLHGNFNYKQIPIRAGNAIKHARYQARVPKAR